MDAWGARSGETKRRREKFVLVAPSAFISGQSDDFLAQSCFLRDIKGNETGSE